METGNQREGYGRSRGKWSRKKEREKQKEQQEGDYLPNWKHLVNKIKNKKAKKKEGAIREI